MYKLPVLVVFAVLASHVQAQISKVVNAASFVQNTSLSPGSIITILGTNLTNTTDYGNPSDLPKTLGGVTVTIAGKQSNLFYVSPTQVNAQIDPTVPAGAAELSLVSPTGTFTANLTIQAPGAPGLFSMNGSGSRDGAVINAVTFAPGPFSVTTGGQPTYLAIYGTGISLATQPSVRVHGVELPVRWYGDAPGFTGMQQINVELVPSLAGAGRVELVVTSGGHTSNVVEIMILPNFGQGPFAPEEEHQYRNRELSSIAYIPGTSRVLALDESDDVVRVINVKDRTVVGTIVLPEGAEPVAAAVTADAKLALVAERNRGKVAIIDLATLTVLSPEIAVGNGPVSIGILDDLAVVVNQVSDNVSIIRISTKEVVGTVAVGRGPRSVAIDSMGKRALITNQDDGTVSVINLAVTPFAAGTPFNLGADTRPQSIVVLPMLGLAVITEPSATSTGKVVLVSSGDGALMGTIDVNPSGLGGSGAIAATDTTVYFANQTSGTITIAKITKSGPPAEFSLSNLAVDIGARALAIDTVDNLLVVASEGSGTLVLVDLGTNQIVGRINAVISEHERDGEKHDDHEDRGRAANVPVVTQLTPNTGAAGATIQLVITGTNLTGATDVIVLDPDLLPGKGKGRGNGMSGNHGHGAFGIRDAAFTVTGITVNAAGTQVTATVAIKPGTKGSRVVRVLTPNGESTFVANANNQFTVQ